MPMKTSFLLVGLLVTTVVAAQIRTAPPAELAAPRDSQELSPVAHVGDATAIDPQFDLLRKQISTLKRQQSEQQDEIAHLQSCVTELVKATKMNTHNSPGLMTSISKPKDDDEDELADHIATLAPRPAPANLAACD
jgi:gas vesicle protein